MNAISYTASDTILENSSQQNIKNEPNPKEDRSLPGNKKG